MYPQHKKTIILEIVILGICLALTLQSVTCKIGYGPNPITVLRKIFLEGITLLQLKDSGTVTGQGSIPATLNIVIPFSFQCKK